MKRGFGKGFFAGALAVTLVVGLSVTALAATRTIKVDDDIRITLNGANFTPKDADGKEVPLFSYDGTTYAPVRAICEAAGLKVDYDSATYTAVLTTQDQYVASTPAPPTISPRSRPRARLSSTPASTPATPSSSRPVWTGMTARYTMRWSSTPATPSMTTTSTL